MAFPLVKGSTTQQSSLTQEDFGLIRTWLAQISKLNIDISETMVEEMQSYFVRKRNETDGKDIDETSFGRRIIVAKGLARVSGRTSMSSENWRQSLEICSAWETRRK